MAGAGHRAFDLAALYRRLPGAGESLRVDHIFIVENRSDPPRTFTGEAETLRFRLPPEALLLEVPTVSATGETGMPVPQSSFPVGADGDYAIRTAFKPGETEIVLSYEVRYDGERHEAALIAPRASPRSCCSPRRRTSASKSPRRGPRLGDPRPRPNAGLTAARKFDGGGREAVGMVFSGGSIPAPAAGSRPLPALVNEPEAAGPGPEGQRSEPSVCSPTRPAPRSGRWPC